MSNHTVVEEQRMGVIFDGTDEQKIEWMWYALKMKFHQPRYKDLLLFTGDMTLMEQGRGDWAEVDGWLGQLTMILRDDIREENEYDIK